MSNNENWKETTLSLGTSMVQIQVRLFGYFPGNPGDVMMPPSPLSFPPQPKIKSTSSRSINELHSEV